MSDTLSVRVRVIGYLKTLRVVMLALEVAQHACRPHGSPRGESRGCDDHRGAARAGRGRGEAAVTAVVASKVEGGSRGNPLNLI
jgi:hypothetical protein